MRRFIFCCVAFIGWLTASAQEQSAENTNPPSVKWLQLRTSHFKILYPDGFEAQAQRMANTLEHIYEPESRSLGARPRRFSVVLQNQSALSNGFVSMAPKRSEFYAMPTQRYNFLGTNDWLDLLAVHEFRHMVQFQRSSTGFNKLVHVAFGPATLSAMAFAGAPQWFWEGDAVAVETAVTPSGRGNIPNFDMVFRTNLLEGRTFNYHKQYLRSYKHNIPDHYVLGYHLVSYLRQHMNRPDVWGNVAGRAWNWSFVPFTFSNALRKETGLFVTDLYDEAADHLRLQWQAQLDTLTLTSFETIQANANRAYTDYRFPQELPDGSVVALKNGIGDIEQYVQVKEGVEKVLYTPGFLNESDMLSVADGKIAWNEYGFDPRWRARTYSVIKVYDINTRRTTRITGKSRYAGAALSPDGEQLATVETTTGYQTRLVVLSVADSGRVLKTFENDSNAYYSMPRFSADGQHLVVLKTTAKGRTITRIRIDKAEAVDLLPVAHENIGHPVLWQDYVLFNAPLNGIDNISAVRLSTGERFQVTESRYGAYSPCVSADGRTLYYSDQTRDGLRIVRTTFDPATWRKWTGKIYARPFAAQLREQEGNPNLLAKVPQKAFASKRYRPISGIVNPYAWGAYLNTNLTGGTIGITSQDVLSTTKFSAGYDYDINEQVGGWNVTASLQRWFPILDVSANWRDRKVDEGDLPIRFVERSGNQITLDSTVVRNATFTWRENTLEAGLRIPLVTTKSRFIGNFTVGNYVGVSNVSEFSNTITGPNRFIPALIVNDTIRSVYSFRSYVGNGQLLYNHFFASGYRLLKQSRRDINSKWGQMFVLHGYGTPFGGDYEGNQFSFYTTLFFPGLFKHHSLWGYWGYQKTEIQEITLEDNNYYFRNQVPTPRGVDVRRWEKFYTMSANYTLPVWYPDIALGPVLNIQRFRLNGFVDYGFGSLARQRETLSETYLSAGVEAKFDINVLRFLPQLDIGFRYSYGFQPVAVSRFEFLLGTINF